MPKFIEIKKLCVDGWTYNVVHTYARADRRMRPTVLFDLEQST